jgi:hypothetical protein
MDEALPVTVVIYPVPHCYVLKERRCGLYEFKVGGVVCPLTLGKVGRGIGTYTEI